MKWRQSTDKTAIAVCLSIAFVAASILLFAPNVNADPGWEEQFTGQSNFEETYPSCKKAGGVIAPNNNAASAGKWQNYACESDANPYCQATWYSGASDVNNTTFTVRCYPDIAAFRDDGKTMKDSIDALADWVFGTDSYNQEDFENAGTELPGSNSLISKECNKSNPFGWFLCGAADVVSNAIDSMIKDFLLPMLQWRIVI